MDGSIEDAFFPPKSPENGYKMGTKKGHKSSKSNGKIIWHATKFPGIRYREHRTRKHGVGKDRYFQIRYQRDGKRIEEKLGWGTEGWTAEKAANELAELKKNYALGEGPTTLKEKREIAEDAKRAEQERQAQSEKDAVTVNGYWSDTYLPAAKVAKPASWKAEKNYFENWIKPAVGDLPIRDLRPLHVEKIKRALMAKGRSPRTVEYAIACTRQIWNQARRDGVVSGENPTAEVRRPRVDNRRLRFLTQDEAGCLLTEIKDRSQRVYDMTLLSLHCGLRAIEIFRLRWGSINFAEGIIYVEGKGGKTRPAFMTDRVRKMLESIPEGKPGDLVFPDRNGKQIARVSNVFQRSVSKLGLNEGVTDPKQRVVFHTCRHTFASWHVQRGTDLYTVQQLMGHASLSMTERYSHLSRSTLLNATKGFEKSLSGATKADGAKIVSIEGEGGGHGS